GRRGGEIATQGLSREARTEDGAQLKTCLDRQNQTECLFLLGETTWALNEGRHCRAWHRKSGLPDLRRSILRNSGKPELRCNPSIFAKNFWRRRWMRG